MKELLTSNKFWDSCSCACKIMEPVVQILQMVDGDKKPILPSSYYALALMREKVRENARGRSVAQYMKI